MEMETGSVTDSITAVHSKGPEALLKAKYHSVEIIIDSFVDSITTIYSRDVKRY